MNDVSFHVPYIFGSKQNLSGEERKQLQKGDRGAWYQERHALGPNRPERGKANSW